MRKLFLLLLPAYLLSFCIGSFPLCLSAVADEPSAVIVAEDEYAISLKLQVPQVIDNMSSVGYRKYQTQTIKGKMYICWLDDGGFALDFDELENKNFKVRSTRVKYKGTEGKEIVYSRFNWIGSNKTNVFKVPTICFYLELEPSYAMGGNNEDNSFYVLVSGKGSSAIKKTVGCRIATSFSGYVAGTQGCGCMAYGHKSPTRVGAVSGPSNATDDVVPTYGTWSAKLVRRRGRGCTPILR